MDDDLFSSILYLVPAALFIFFRFLGGGKKARAAKERGTREDAARRELARRVREEMEASRPAVPLSRISGREPEVQEWEPHWVTETDSDLAEPSGPTAGQGIPDEEGPEPNQRLVFLETELEGTISSLPAGSLAGFAPSPAVDSAPAIRTAGPGSFDQYPISGAGPSLPSPADLSRSQAAESARTAPGPFPSSVEKLSPLKRAVVLAEILGPPKGA